METFQKNMKRESGLQAVLICAECIVGKERKVDFVSLDKKY